MFLPLHSSPLYPSTGAGWVWLIRDHLHLVSWPRAPGLATSPGYHLNWGSSILHPQYYGDQRRLPPEFFWKNAPLSWPEAFLTEKEVSQELQLEPGTYLVVPCTSEAGQESEFLLRVFSRKHIFQ